MNVDMAEEQKEFTPITTQEEFNQRIQARIERAVKPFADYEQLKTSNAELTEQLKQFQSGADKTAADIEALNKTIAEQKAAIGKYERDSVKIEAAMKLVLPFEMASRLQGTTPEEIHADAEKLAGLIQNQQPKAPLRNQEGEQEVDGVTAAFRKLNPNIKF